MINKPEWVKEGEDLTYGDEELKTARNCFAYIIGNTTMGYEKYGPTFSTLEFWDGLQGHDYNDK